MHRSAISPGTIAEAINESLRQQVVQSTITETGRALAAVATQMRDVSREFGNRAADLGDRYSGSVAQAVRAIQEINRTGSDAIAATRRGAQEIIGYLSSGIPMGDMRGLDSDFGYGFRVGTNVSALA